MMMCEEKGRSLAHFNGFLKFFFTRQYTVITAQNARQLLCDRLIYNSICPYL